MKKKTTTIVSVIIVIAIIVIIVACSTPRDRKYDEAAVKAAAIELLTAAEDLNEIYYGKGIAFLEESKHNISIYCEADPAALDGYGIKTVEELRQKTMAVFSTAQCNSMFKSAFSGSFSQGTSNMSRYYQKYDDKNKNPVCIMVHSSYEPLMNGENIYNLDTLKVTGSKGEFVYITVDVTVIYGDKTQTNTLSIRLIEESNGWRISSTSFSNYNELNDIYNELQKG